MSVALWQSTNISRCTLHLTVCGQSTPRFARVSLKQRRQSKRICRASLYVTPNHDAFGKQLTMASLLQTKVGLEGKNCGDAFSSAMFFFFFTSRYLRPNGLHSLTDLQNCIPLNANQLYTIPERCGAFSRAFTPSLNTDILMGHNFGGYLKNHMQKDHK